ncbi:MULTISPECIES: LCP family protein [unclassified Granulicatella]|uniref:LCP family protein n=1 Tax=unclassified Granulicatella TaxID=2630493 RepID=UPI0010741182|nr:MULTISPECIES: LCP family protein [unclassified Granulicatella]MBF0779497.1 LCP family protein [Granulicatella sp. 19428wC4_WM01]TFU96463.1 LytR family transcriptional regulator [Granulicatella sp. WM01]
MESRRTRAQRFKQQKQKNTGFIYVLTCLLALMAILSSAYVVYAMVRYNILNFRSLNYIVYGVIAFVIFLLLIFIFTKRAKKTALTLSLVFALIFGYTAYSIFNGLGAFSNLSKSTKTKTETMSVVVLANSPINDVHDLSGQTVPAPTNMDNDNIQSLLTHIKEKTKTELSLGQVDSYAKAYQQLISGEVKAMILNSSYETLLENADKEYASKIKKIYEYTVTKEVVQDENKVKTSSDGRVFNVYVSGIDTYGSISTVSRSDVNIIMTVNTNTKKVLLTTTPRDSYVRIADGGNNQYDKLTHAGIYGVEASVHTLENLYDINLDYYARINFTSFLKLIDLVGGVDVYNPADFTSSEGVYFESGTIHLDSDRALAFVRERYNLPNGDADRAANQQKVIAAIIGKLTQPGNLVNMNSILQQLSSSLQTNMPFETIMLLANGQLDSGGQYKVDSQALLTHGTMGLPSYAMPGYDLYMGVVDDDSLANVKAAVQSVINGE